MELVDAIRLASSKIAVNLKEKQLEAILSFMSGKDVFAHRIRKVFNM